MTWKIKKVSEIGDVKGGKRLPKGEVVSNNPSAHPYIRVTDMNGSRIDPRNVMYISDNVYKKISRYTISKDDIFISIAGTIGVICRIPAVLDGSNLTENAAKIVLKNDEVTRDFLYYFLNSHEGQGQIRQRIGGATQPKLALDRIRSIEIRYPNLPGQKRISEILNSFNAVVDHLSDKLRLLQDLLHTKFECLMAESLDSGQSRMAQLGDIANSINVKYSEENNFNLPLIDLSSINSRNLAIESVKKADDLQSSRILFSAGDILFGSIRCYLHKVALAPFEGITNVSVIVARAKDPLYNAFLTAMLSSQSTVDWASRNSNGTKMPTISWDVLSSMEVAMPSEKLIRDFNEHAEVLVQSIKNLTLMRLNIITQLSETANMLFAEGRA